MKKFNELTNSVRVSFAFVCDYASNARPAFIDDGRAIKVNPAEPRHIVIIDDMAIDDAVKVLNNEETKRVDVVARAIASEAGKLAPVQCIEYYLKNAIIDSAKYYVSKKGDIVSRVNRVYVSYASVARAFKNVHGEALYENTHFSKTTLPAFKNQLEAWHAENNVLGNVSNRDVNRLLNEVSREMFPGAKYVIRTCDSAWFKASFATACNDYTWKTRGKGTIKALLTKAVIHGYNKIDYKTNEEKTSIVF